MFSFSRINSKDNPLQMYLSLCELDRGRTGDDVLSPQTVKLLGTKYHQYSDQYLIFSEFKQLNNASIAAFITAADSLSGIKERNLRANALGIFQANLGIWEILARQRQIPDADMNESWQAVVHPFEGGLASNVQLFDEGRASLGEVFRAASGKPELSQDEVIALLAGPEQSTAVGQQVRQSIASEIRSVLNDQRLVSLDSIFGVADGLHEMATGKGVNSSLLREVADLTDFEMPRPFFTPTERSVWATGLYNNNHTALEMRTDLTKIINSRASAAELEQARGELVSFLRDTLVGMNYAYYEPPLDQALHSNPLFVRAHDFLAEAGADDSDSWETSRLVGRGWSAGGGAHLQGSLAQLPYVLARAEQDFIVPENLQALIWDDLVPDLVSTSTFSRWWGIPRQELHTVALYQRTGEELLQSSGRDPQLRTLVVNILSDVMLPQRSTELEQALRSGDVNEIFPDIAPAETFYLAAEYRRRFPGDVSHVGAAGKELEDSSIRNPGDTNLDRISADFGIPHPALGQSYAREILTMKPFPSFIGTPSRLMAETWDSSNLYWARLADEMGYSPEMLNRIVPQLTHRMVEKIFATNFEDWPAILRAMRETGEEFRKGEVPAITREGAAPGH